jgi:dsRNA-specific ribonuclease
LIAEINNKILKKPVALLQEVCTKLNIAHPKYEVVETVGLPHEIIFVYKIENYAQFGVEQGSGASKSGAKHAAALNALYKLKGMTENDKFNQDLDELILKSIEASCTSDATKSRPTSISEDIVEDTTPNPVGELLEVTQRFSLRPPEFEFVDEEGPPHDKIFVCNVKCKLGTPEFTQQGRGKSKKIAKRQAALKLLIQIKSNVDLSKSLEEAAAGHNLNSNSNGHSSAANSSKEKFHKKFTPYTFFSTLKASTQATMNKIAHFSSDNGSSTTDSSLFQLCLNNKVLDLLDQLAAEEGFKYEIFEIPHASDTGNYAS